MKHDGVVNGASFTKDERRILSWSEDKTLRLWDVSWRGENLFEIACNYTPKIHVLAGLTARYGIKVTDAICEPGKRIPVPNWSKIEAAPKGE
jgi:WD40 repeat protein